MRYVLVLVVMLSAVTALAEAPAQPAPAAVAQSTLADQTDVAVTVYNNNLALVRDRRKLSLGTGELSLRFMDVAQQIKPETVELRSLSKPGSLAILEQNYEYDLLSPAKLMEKYVGKQVRLLNFNKDILLDKVDAELLSVNEGPIYKVNNEIYLGHPGNVVLPQIPENLIAKPTLVWLVNNTSANQEIEANYLTNGFSWMADYVLTVDKSEAKMDVAGWVTLKNESGAQYTNAQLKLVAGDVNVAQPPRREMMGRAKVALESNAPAPPMREESFSEYHLYTLPRRTTIKQNQSKQVSLLTASGVKVGKVYEYAGQQQYYFNPFPPLKDQKVAVFLKFENKKANAMGMPLPAGTMRVYQQDSDGMLQFTGEDRIKHTPQDEDVKIKIGDAFDIVAERAQKDFQKLGDRMTESSYEIKIRNHKKSDVSVDIIEHLTSDWEILEQSHKSVKKDSQTAVFTVPVPKDGETVVTYRVRVKW